MNSISKSSIPIFLIIIIDYIMSVLPEYAMYCNYSIVIILLLCFLYTSISKKIKYIDIFAILAAVILIIISRDTTRISLFVFAISLNINTLKNKQVLKHILALNLICLSIIIIAYLLGFNKSYDTEIWRPLLGKTVPRMSFGFTHPNQFMIRVFVIFCMAILLYNNLITYLLSIIIGYFFYKTTHSRTTYYIMIGIICVLLIKWIFQKITNKNYTHFIKPKCTLCAIPLLLIFSILLSYYGKNTVFDTYFSGRLTLNYKYLEQGFSMLGNASLEDATFDNSYIQMFLSKGIIYFLAFSIIFFFKFKKCRFDFKSYVILIGILALAFMEVCLLKYSIMLLFGMLINYNDQSQIKIQGEIK